MSPRHGVPAIAWWPGTINPGSRAPRIQLAPEKVTEYEHTAQKHSKRQREGYTGPITLSSYEKFQYVREMLKKEGISIPLPTGN